MAVGQIGCSWSWVITWFVGKKEKGYYLSSKTNSLELGEGSREKCVFERASFDFYILVFIFGLKISHGVFWFGQGVIGKFDHFERS